MALRRAPLGTTQALPSPLEPASEKPVMTRQRTRAAQQAELDADHGRRSTRRTPPKHSCPSDSEDDDRPPRRTSKRLGGCAAHPPRTRRRTDDNKENIAPVRQVSRAVLDAEAQVQRAPRVLGEAIATRTRARARQQRVDAERGMDGGAEPASADKAPEDGTGAAPTAEAPGADAATARETALPSPPRTPTRRPTRAPTPSPATSAATVSDAPSTPSTAVTTPSTTPTKPAPTLHAQARALLRDGAEAPLVGRAKERAAVHTFLAHSLEEAPQSSGCLYLSGMPGTGKTALVRAVLAERAASAQTTLINCVGLSHPHQVATEILVALGERRTDDAARDLERLEAELERPRRAPLVIVLDELDHLLHTRVHQNVLYRLFCLPTRVRHAARVALIGIANSLDLTERFVPLLSSRGVQPEHMQFQPMGAADVCAVVHGRLQHLAAPGAELFARPALELLARKLTAVSGDLRRALDTARQALDLAEQEHAPRVQPSHILRVLAHMAGHAQIARVRALGIHAKLLLLAWVTIQERVAAKLSDAATADGSTRIADLEAAYQTMLQDDAGFASPLETSELLDVLERLEAQGVVRIYAEATGGSAPHAFSKSGGTRTPGAPVRRVSPSGKRAAAKQLLGTNRRMVPTLDRESLVKALTTRGAGADEQHTPTVVEAMARLLRHAEDRVLRATLWRTEQPLREQVRAEELGGGRSARPSLPL